MSAFDKTMSLEIKEINSFEDEIKSIGFKKFKTGKNDYVFKNKEKFPLITIEKSLSEWSSGKRLEYNISYDDNNNNTYDFDNIIDIDFTPNTFNIIKLVDLRKNVYTKYFNNEIRKRKIKNLLDGDSQEVV